MNKHYLVLNLVANSYGDPEVSEVMYLEAAVTNEAFEIVGDRVFTCAVDIPDMEDMLSELPVSRREALSASGLVDACQNNGLSPSDAGFQLYLWILERGQEVEQPTVLVPCGFQLHRLLPIFSEFVQMRFDANQPVHELTSFFPYVQFHGPTYDPDMLGLRTALEYARRVQACLGSN